MELDFEEEPQESLASILQRIEYPSQEHHANASNGSHRRNYRGSGDNQTRDRKRDQQEQSRSSIRERHSRTRDQTRLRNRQDTIFLQDENESLTEKAFPSFRRTDSAHLRSHRDSVRHEKGGVLPQVSGTPSSNDRVLSESTESLCYQQPSRIPFTGQIEMKSHQTRSSPKTTATASPSVVEYEEDIPEILDPSFSSQAHTTTGKSKSGSKTSHRKHKQEISSSLQLDQEESSAPSEYNKVSELLQEMGLQPPFPYLHRTYVDTDVISTPLPSPARSNQLGDLPKQSQSSSSPRQKTRAHKKTEQEQIPPSPDSKSPTSTPTARQSRRDHSFRNGDHSPLARELLPTNDTYIDQRPSVFEPDQYLTIESSPKRHPKDTVSRSAKLRDECQDFLPHHSPKASEGTLSSRPQIHSSDHDDLEYHAPPKSKRKPIIHGTRQNAHRQTRIDSIQNMDRPVSSLSPPSSSPSTPKKR